MSELPQFDELWDYDDPVGSEQRFRALLPGAEASGDAGYRVELLTQLARSQGLQRQFEAAHATLDLALGLLPDASPRAEVRYLLERGRVYNSSGQKDQAQALFAQAWQLGKQVRQDFYAVDAAHMLAIVAQGQDALAWNLKALEYAEISRQPRARNWRGSLYNNLGWTYFEQGDYHTALEMFEQALEARREGGDEELIRVARWCVAKAYRLLGRPDEALTEQQALLKEYESMGQQPGYTYEELAENLLALGRAADAQPYFAKSYAVLSQDPWLVEAEPERLARLKELGAGAV